jgi:hypothetical protein
MKTMRIILSILFLVLTLQSKAQLSVSFTVTNCTCFGSTDGVAIATASGGAAPYTYQWSILPVAAGAQQTITGLAASYYACTVHDANDNKITSGVNVTQPTALDLTTHDSHKVTCYHCFNGWITLDPQGSVSPYSYVWNDGPGSQNRYNIGGGDYEVLVTDANGCSANMQFSIEEPPRDDWSMTGNTGSDPSAQYMGTSDAQDFVFKTNNAERLRILSNGNLDIPAFAGTGDRNIYVDNNGILHTSLSFSCAPWCTSGNAGTDPSTQFIGTTDAVDLALRANNTLAMKINSDGANTNIQIGQPGTGINYITSSANNPLLIHAMGSLNLQSMIGGMQLIAANDMQLVAPVFSFFEGNVGIATGAPQDKFQVNDGSGKLAIGSLASVDIGYAESNSLGWGTSYLGINAVRSSSGWITKSDGSHNGGNIIYGDINGNLRFVTIPNASPTTADQPPISDATILSNSKMIIQSDGNVGIGATNPGSEYYSGDADPRVLHIIGTTPVLRLEDSWGENSSEATNFEISSSNGTGRLISDHNVAIFLDADHDNDDEAFYILKNDHYWSTTATELFKVNEQGIASARGMKVTMGDFPDYVFNNDYKLKSINDLEEYINDNHHLPNIPSAADVKKDGLDLGDTQARLLEKVEELTLYVIDLQKQIADLKKNK